ncbi:MAG: PBP1A family penicillin-binding protein [Pseudobutyrivibrio sp.]|nr:PBP1A family penicillin-binding protein [Pseudobutyrivibrio sp.]
MSKAERRKKTKTERVLGLLKFQIALLIILIAAVAYYYVGGYASQVSDLKSEASSLVKQSSPETFRQTETSIVYDANGETISVLKGEKDVYYLTYNEIPAYVTQAIISIEDKKFYKHKGVDYKAIIRAAIAMVKNGEATQGGSTITQQLARTMYLSNEKTWQRKVEEIYIASELEERYSKEDILEFYLNNVYFANGYYGIQAAAKGYFSKDASELTLSEICYLLAIPNSPTYYDPVLNPDHTMKRRNIILGSMYKDKIISEQTYNNALAEEIVLNRPDSIKNNYVETYTYYCATRVLMEMDGFEFKTDFSTTNGRKSYEKQYAQSYDQWNRTLFTEGYRIYTSIDMNMQNQLQQTIDENLSEFQDLNDEGIYALQGAAVSIDNETGQVVAIVGGRTQDVSGYTLNRAFQSYRQPGSSIKPLLVYTPQLERGYTPDTIVFDQPIEDGPENSNGAYSGEITLRQAVMYSKNTIAWQLYEELTPQVGMKYLKNLGFSQLVEEDYGMAACLGGLTVGVSPLEMATGYATIENDGYMRNPGCITKITDADGNIIYEAKPEEIEIYEENATRNMTSMLESVITDGTAKGAALTDMPCAGKTGTTNSNRDGWFVGYTRYYTTSVWVGYDIPKKVPGLTGSSYPARIWQQYMENVHENKSSIDFLAPVEYIGTDDLESVPEEESVEGDDESEESDVVEEAPVPEETETYQVITETFDGTEVPEGAIPENATDIQITTTTE